MRPLLILAAIVYLPVVGSTAVLDDKDDFSCAASQFGNLPLYFIENQGQIESNDVAFYVTGSDKTLYFTPEGITFALKGDGNERWTVKLSFVGAQPVKPVGRDKQKAVLSYFRGRSENWKTGISTYGELVYEDLWPGIDLVYYGSVNKLKYEFIVEPGADPGMIRLEYCGLSDLNITEAGALKVTTPVGSFVDDVLFAYQFLDGEAEEVAMRYVLEEKVDIDRLSFTFDLGDYDPSEPLILDPAMLVYCGFIGGSDWDVCHDIAVDMDGNAYVVGIARSMQNSFPVKIGPDLTHNSPGADDIFVAKINAQGTAFFYCGYIGGTSWDTSAGIAIDSQGCAYVTGCTKSDQSSFPVTVGPDLTHNGGTDAFVAKINPSGTGLDYCGYIGGSGLADTCDDIEVDAQGNAYVTGWTNSGQSTFPVTVGPDLTHNGGGFYGGDGFVAKVNDQGTALVYCGYIGGDNEERCGGITIDDDWNAYVTGWTESDQSSFPVAVGPDLTHNGNGDAFVAKINAQGTQLLYCGYIGGSLEDSASAIVVDLDGDAHVAGTTESDETTFPVVLGPDLTHNGDSDAFVAKVNSLGTSLEFCGYIGGTGMDYAEGIAIDTFKNIHISGGTRSNEYSFPVVVGPDLSYNGWGDVFVARLNTMGTEIDYCGYIGGIENDASWGGMVTDHNGDAYVAGLTYSDESSFPAINGPDLSHNGDYDAFIAKVMYIPPLTADSLSLSALNGGTVNFSLDAATWNADRYYLLLGGVTGTKPGTPLPGGYATLPLNMDVFTDIVFANLNGPLFSNFLGQLDADGRADASLFSPPLPSVAVGVNLYFAFCCNNPFDFVSNPLQVEIVP